MAKLDWRATRLGARWLQGFTGDLMVAEVQDSLGEPPWSWSMPWTETKPLSGCHSTFFGRRGGEAPTVEEAKAAAEAEWIKWLTMAGLAPSPSTQDRS